MAESCANCGRADLLQPDVANYQCLACGALTSMSTGTVVAPQVSTAPNLSNAGFPVVELGTDVERDDVGEDRRVRPINDGDAPVPAPAPVVASEPVVETPRPARVDEGYVPAEAVVEPVEVTPAPAVDPVPGTPINAPIDLNALTPEQVAAIEAIAHPEA